VEPQGARYEGERCAWAPDSIETSGITVGGQVLPWVNKQRIENTQGAFLYLCEQHRPCQRVAHIKER
jgi:hypothetical protein